MVQSSPSLAGGPLADNGAALGADVAVEAAEGAGSCRSQCRQCREVRELAWKAEVIYRQVIDDVVSAASTEPVSKELY